MLSPEEDKQFLLGFCKSFKVFANLYTTHLAGENEKRKLFTVLWQELYGAVSNGDINYLKEISCIIEYLCKVDELSNLKLFYDCHDNPLKYTNLVILSCKFNQLEILRHLFSNGISLISNLSAIMGKSISPHDEDEFLHDAFYYAIRSKQVKLLETLISKWPDNLMNENLSKLTSLLTSNYEFLKIRNIDLSSDMEVFVLQKVINLRFFSNSKLNDEVIKVSLEYLEERSQYLVKIIDLLLKKHSSTSDLSDEFLFIAKHIVLNMHVLKRHLRHSYSVLPWEEMEFSLVSFISTLTTNQTMNFFYLLILNKERIIYHLQNFNDKFKEFVSGMRKIGIKKLNYLPKMDREQVVMNITEKHPPFSDLVNDHRQIRDHYSLEKICKYLKIAMSIDPKEKEGKLVLTRTLQVIGEFLKNTLESPNLSPITCQTLLDSFPKYTKRVLIDLRNSLSHAFSLSERIALEENLDPCFFIVLQNDTRKMYDVLHSFLYYHKIKIIKNLIVKLSVNRDTDEILHAANLFKNIEIDLIFPKCDPVLEHEKLKNLVNELKLKAGGKDEMITKHLHNINDIFELYSAKLENILGAFFLGVTALKSLCKLSSTVNPNDLLHEMNNVVSKIFNAIQIKTVDEKQISDLAFRLLRLNLKEVENPDVLEKIVWNICYITETDVGNLKWIQALRNKFQVNFSSTPEEKVNKKTFRDSYYEVINSKISDLKQIIEKNVSHKALHYYPLQSSMKLLPVFEMLVLDVMSILSLSRGYLENNIYILDDNLPLLTGKSLRNHLAHCNAVADILSDSALSLFFNAENLSDLNIYECNSQIGQTNIITVLDLRNKFHRGLSILINQENMFKALEGGNLTVVLDCLKKGADINAKNQDEWSSMHFAAKSNGSEIINFVLRNVLHPEAKNKQGQNALHISAMYGKLENVICLLESKVVLIDDLDESLKSALHLASENGCIDVVNELLKHNAEMFIYDAMLYSPLDLAVLGNHLAVVNLLIRKKPDLLHSDLKGFNCLHIAASFGYTELVKIFLNYFDVNIRSDIDWTPLHEAARHGHKNVVAVLIENGASVNARVNSGHTPLHYAAREGYDEIVDILLKNEASVNSVEIENNSPLHFAVGRNHGAVVSSLISRKVNLNIQNSDGMTALHFSVANGNLQIISDLLECNAEVNVQNLSGSSPLHLASSCHNKKIVEFLVQKGANINSQDKTGLTALHLSSQSGNVDITEYLIKNGADIYLKDRNGGLPLHAAAMHGCIGIIQLLFDLNCDINVENILGMTPLMYAAFKGDENLVAFLLKNNANINAENSTGGTALHAAVVGKCPAVIRLLLKYGAYINSEDIENCRPIDLAVMSGQMESVQILLHHGANVNYSSKVLPLNLAIKENHVDIVKILIKRHFDVTDGDPLHLAIFLGDSHIVKILLQNKANINLKDDINGFTPLHTAAFCGNLSIVGILLNNGANIDAVDEKYKDSPLNYAAQMGFSDIVQILINKGANVNKKSTDGATPLHFAAVGGHVDVVKVLLKSGSKLSPDGENRTAFELAVSRGFLGVAECILQTSKVDLNSIGALGYTVLHIASQEGILRMVKYLTYKGSDIYIGNEKGSKAIHIASREGHTDVVKFFIEKGMSVDEPGNDGQTVLHYAAMSGQFETAKYLIENGASVDARDKNNCTPALFASIFGHNNILKILFENGAIFRSINLFNPAAPILMRTESLFKDLQRARDCCIEKYMRGDVFINVKDSNHKTPLHYASINGNIIAVQELLNNFADPNFIDEQGFTPLHYASKKSHLEVVLALLSNGAIYNVCSISGECPIVLSRDPIIRKTLELLEKSFDGINNNQRGFINELNKIKDIRITKALFNAKNSKKETLVIAAMSNNYSYTNDLVGHYKFLSDYKNAKESFDKGDYQKAQQIFNSLWEKRKQVLGADCPFSMEIEVNLCQIMFQQGKLKKVLSQLHKIFKKYESLFGPDSSNCLQTRSFIALVKHKLGYNDEALTVYRDVFKKQKELLGPNHPDTMETYFHMGLVLTSLEFYEEALALNQEIFEIRKRELGSNHPLTLLSQNNVAHVLSNNNQLNESLRIFEEVHKKKSLVFGKTHTTTLNTRFSMAEVLRNLRRFDEALKHLNEILRLQKDTLGVHHPDTLLTQSSLGSLFMDIGRKVGALQIFNEIREPIRKSFHESHALVRNIDIRLQVLHEIMNLTLYDPTKIEKSYEKKLHKAASIGDIKTIQDLLIKGANINHQDSFGITPMHLAISNCQTSMFNFLLKLGADVTLLTSKGNSLLHTASLKGQIETVKALLKEISKDKLYDFINTKTFVMGATALHVAAEKGYLDIIKILLANRAQFNVKNKENKTPYQLSNEPRVKKFLMKVFDIFEDATNGKNILIKKLEEEEMDEFDSLVNTVNTDGHNLLQVVIKTKNKSITNQLLKLIQKRQSI